MSPSDDDLVKQFNTSYMPEYEPPESFTGPRFHIRNDYPMHVGCEQHGPWLDINFRQEPKKYIEELLKYCFEGMPECDFVAQKNHKRNWYHAPWMHYHGSGREPVHGLTYERPTPPYELAITQGSWLQTWACGYFNEPAATAFARVWANKAKPEWNDDIRFPKGSVVFKILMTDASVKELPFLKGSPRWQAFTAQQPDEDEEPIPNLRNTAPSRLRLLQVDVAARDERSETAWTFGTFVYDGRCLASDVHHPVLPDPGWYRLIPVGLQWGNDPQLTQAAFDERGDRPVEHWINPAADELLRQLRADRPTWGWNGRMNGPADNFISACLSCHSVAQKIPEEDVHKDELDVLVPPNPVKDRKGQWIPVDDKITMRWFRNLKDMRFNPNTASGDYSLQMMIGHFNYNRYRKELDPQNRAPRSGHF